MFWVFINNEPKESVVKVYTLDSTDMFQLTHYTQGGRVLVVTFGMKGSGLSRRGFGTDFVLSLGYDHIFVSQKKGSQFQGLSWQRFESALGDVAEKYDEVYAYGSSLAGYCAIYYGGCIDANIVAISPRNSAHPLVREEQFFDLDYIHEEINDVPLSKGRPPLIMYDPFHDVDAVFAEKLVLPAYPDSNVVKIPHAGHQVGPVLTSLGKLKCILVDYFEKGVVPRLDIPKEENFVYLQKCAFEHIYSGDYNSGEEFLLRSYSIDPGRTLASIDEFQRVAGYKFNFPDPVHSEKFYEKLAKIAAGDEPSAVLRDLALLCEKAGDIGSAKLFMEKAKNLNPEGPMIKKKLNLYRSILYAVR